MLKDSKAWPKDQTLIKSGFAANEFISCEGSFDDGQSMRFELAVALEKLGGKYKNSWAKTERQELRLSWTTDMFAGGDDKSSWTTRDHFTTVAYGSLPESGAAFAQSFVISLQNEWLNICDDIKKHLYQNVSRPQTDFHVISLSNSLPPLFEHHVD